LFLSAHCVLVGPPQLLARNSFLFSFKIAHRLLQEIIKN
jgi:hypothetical protein